jgi:sec-independent protein translocase protein TatA
MLSSVFLFLNIGSGEMVLIVFAALMLFGGEKLPELARGLGKGIRDFKDASDDVKREINNQINNYEPKKTEVKQLAQEEEKPEEEQHVYPPIEGTMPMAEYTATDVIDETELHNPEAPETYNDDTELKHPVTGSANKNSIIDLTKTTDVDAGSTKVEEEYKQS